MIASTPATSEDRTAVAEQLERILASPLFKQSKRYSPFLRYVVQKTLAGEGETLKERTLGVEIFGRPPGYDSSNDPIVRVTAGEVRKRIAQYYHEPGHDCELRIDLSPGSYVPEFLPTEAARQRAVEVPQHDETSKPAPAARGIVWKRKRLLWPTVAIVSALMSLAGFSYWRLVRSSVVEQWWQPAVHSPIPVLFSVGTIDSVDAGFQPITEVSHPAQPAQSIEGHVRSSDHIGLIDAITLERFASLLSAHKQSYRTLASVQTTYNDLRSGPVVLVGALDNTWTIRVTEPLRFHFVLQLKPTISFIADRSHPADTSMRVDFSQPSSEFTKDYAIIARLHDATSDKPVFVVAGIGSNGTAAAAEFVTTDSSLQSLVSQLPRNWQDKNVEAVIQTRVINGQAGPPTLVSVQVW